MSIQKIGVIGAGTMGNGIAQAFAAAGHAVTMSDIGEAQVERGLKAIDASLERLLKKDKGFEWGNAAGFPEGQPLTAFSEAQPVLSLVLGQTNLGQFTLAGGVGFTLGAGPSQPLVEWQEAAASFAYGGDTTFGVCDPEEGYFIGNEERERAIQSVRRFNPSESEEKILARWRPEPDLKLVYLIGTEEAPRIRQRVNVTGGGWHIPD